MIAWRTHMVLLAVAVAVLARAVATHVTTEEALRVAFDPRSAPDARIEAAHLAACRATTRSARLGEELTRAFLDAEDDLLREAAVTIGLCRHALKRTGDGDERTPPLQEAYVYGQMGPDGMTPHRLRALILHRRKVGGKAVGGIGRISSTEADWFLRTLRGDALPPTPQMTAYFQSRDMPSRRTRPRSR